MEPSISPLFNEFPLLTTEHINSCDLSVWYPIYRNHTIESRIIPLSKDFIEYLLEDSLFVPGMDKNSNHEYDVDSDGEDGYIPEEEVYKGPSFPALDATIINCIHELGGAIFPKLNWSSPQDARWIALGHTLKCECPSDIYLLFKSSDFIVHDLKYAYLDCNVSMHRDFVLVLRKWAGANINPSTEFRCFIKKRLLVAVCQRDIANYYPEVLSSKLQYLDLITDFFEMHVQDVMDVYITSQLQVEIIDFNPWASQTDSLLFNWSDILSQKGSNILEIKMIESEGQGSGTQPAHLLNRLPREAFDLSSSGFNLAELAENFNTSIIQES